MLTMVAADIALMEGASRVDPAMVSVSTKRPASPASSIASSAFNPASGDEWEPTQSPVKRVTVRSPSCAEMSPLIGNPSLVRQNSEDIVATRRSYHHRSARRMKSYSESGPMLERMVKTKNRPYSAGDAEDLRRVSISGCAKNKNGTWMFKVDVGSNEFDSYAVRRRFSDFRELHEGLEELVDPKLIPELPHHGVYSVVQLLFSPSPALHHRAKKLEELLQFVNSHPVLSTSSAFIKFIGKSPSSLELGYVSLSGYEAPATDGFIRFKSSLALSGARSQSRSRCLSN